MSHMQHMTDSMDAQISEGSGRALVLAVGQDSEWGRTMALVMGQGGVTPLQEALTTLAAAIGKVGLAVGVLCFVVLFVRCAKALVCHVQHGTDAVHVTSCMPLTGAG